MTITSTPTAGASDVCSVSLTVNKGTEDAGIKVAVEIIVKQGEALCGKEGFMKGGSNTSSGSDSISTEEERSRSASPFKAHTEGSTCSDLLTALGLTSQEKDQVGEGGYAKVHIFMDGEGKPLAVKTYSIKSFLKKGKGAALQLETNLPHDAMVEILGLVVKVNRGAKSLFRLVTKQEGLPEAIAANSEIAATIFPLIMGCNLMELLMNETYEEHGKKKSDSIGSFKELLLMQMMQGLRIIHGFNVIHRDVKLENCMVNREGKVTWIDGDFMIAPDRDGTIPAVEGKAVGSFGCIAPEMSGGFKDVKTYNSKVDLWSFGVAAYILSTGFGEIPFKHYQQDEEVLRRDLLSFGKEQAACADGTKTVLNKARESYGASHTEHFNALSERVVEIINGCLTVDPEKRQWGDSLDDGFFETRVKAS